jgi:hypothetical protein
MSNNGEFRINFLLKFTDIQNTKIWTQFFFVIIETLI